MKFNLEFFGNGVVTARVERVAATDSVNGEPQPFEKSVFLKCFVPVMGTRGIKTATRRGNAGNGHLIKPNQCHCHIFHVYFLTFAPARKLNPFVPANFLTPFQFGGNLPEKSVSVR